MINPDFYPYPVCANLAFDEQEHDKDLLSKCELASNCIEGRSIDEHSKCELASKCVEDCAAYGKVCPYAARSAGHAARKAVAKLRDDSSIFTSDEPSFNRLNSDDLEIGDKLGEGGFCSVHSCMLKTDPNKEYAIKYLKRKAMVNQRQFEHGAADLITEAHFLNALENKHIIRLHGVTAGAVETNVATGKKCGFFIIVDRLYETLEQRLARWRKEHQKQQTGVLTRMTHDYREKRKEEMRERIQIALQIAEAVEYLHDKNIIFRDLKPDNIAFDENGVLKLFDFGLAKELKPGQRDSEGRYELTGNTGSRRYMSPEVAKDQPYNKSVDSYSFGILMHELFSGEKPFNGYSSNKHMSHVVMGGERPKMDSRTTAFWPTNIQWLIKRCWSPFPSFRPDFATIKQTLQDALDGRDTVPDMRPSTADNENKREHSTGAFSLLKHKRVDKAQRSQESKTPFSVPCEAALADTLKEQYHGKHKGMPWYWVFRR